MINKHKYNCSLMTTEQVNHRKPGVFVKWWMRVDVRVTGHYLASSSMRSCLLMPSGISLGMAATHVRNRSIFGLRSPLQQINGTIIIHTIWKIFCGFIILNRSIKTQKTNVIMSSGSLLDIWTLVMLMDRPTSLSRCLRMLSKAFRTWG